MPILLRRLMICLIALVLPTTCLTAAFKESDYYIIFLVTARHLEYEDTKALLKTLIKHSSGFKGLDVGHSWIYLRGIRDGKPHVLEGGQSGETGEKLPKYYDGVINYVRYGYANPTREQKKNPRHEPNPVKYLWEDVDDGFWQEESGGFHPTYAAKFDLTKEQYEAIYRQVDPQTQNYCSYSLIGNQCSSFLNSVAETADIELDHTVTVEFPQKIKLGRKIIHLWTDPKYSVITFASPDVIEISLQQAVAEGKAQNALRWYNRKGRYAGLRRIERWRKDLGRKTTSVSDTLRTVPERIKRLRFYYSR